LAIGSDDDVAQSLPYRIEKAHFCEGGAERVIQCSMRSIIFPQLHRMMIMSWCMMLHVHV
jgi:hypothetical protein